MKERIEIMTIKMILAIVLIVMTVIGLAVCTYIYLRNKTLDEIRADVYQLFLQAEHIYTRTGAGKQKMKWVIGKARGLLPSWAQVIITDELLYKVVQAWFDAVKDLLDDGKFNRSGGAHEDE